MITTYNIPDNDSNNALTTIYIFLLLEIKRKGRKTLSIIKDYSKLIINNY